MSADNVTFKTILPAAIISEGPHWQPSYEAIVYVDIESGKLLRYFPSTGRKQELFVEKGSTGKTVSFVLPVKGHPDILLIGHGKNLSAVRWGPNAPDVSRTEATCLAQIDENKFTRFNDGKCDPRGRIWAGTMGLETSPGVNEKHQGSLFKFSEDLKPTTSVNKVTLSNGLGWSPDRKKLYFIDTLEYTIVQYDYDDATGDISNPDTIIDYKSSDLPNDLPDGMAVDASGNIWAANYFGQKILCIDPATKKIIRTLKTPVRSPTSICFGGSDYSTMYVTSGTPGLSDEELKETPASGAMLEVKGLGVKGLPSVDAVISSDIISKIK